MFNVESKYRLGKTGFERSRFADARSHLSSVEISRNNPTTLSTVIRGFSGKISRRIGTVRSHPRFHGKIATTEEQGDPEEKVIIGANLTFGRKANVVEEKRRNVKKGKRNEETVAGAASAARII